MRCAAVIVTLALASHVAGATSYAPPQRHDVWSADKAFVLDVDPEAASLTVYPADRHAPMWSLHRASDFASYFVSNDGRTIAIVAWQFIRLPDLDKPAVELVRATGRVAAYSYRELLAHPPRPHGASPIGWDWREWLDAASCDGATLSIATAGPWSYAIDLGSGEAVRHVAFAGAAVWALGIAMLVVGVALVAATARARRRDPDQRTRYALAGAAPILGAFALWLRLAGIPFAPATALDMVALVISLASMVAIPVSLVSTWRLPSRERAWRGAAIAAINIAPIAFAFATC